MTELEPVGPRPRDRGDPLAALVGSVVEAWSELRVHKARVLLSLIGVGVAVAALTTVSAGGAIATQAMTESFERGGGRPAMLYVNAYNPTTGEQPKGTALNDAFEAAAQRYQVDYTTRVSWGTLNVQFSDGVMPLNAQGVDAAYGPMHRVELEAGSWLREADANRLAPAIVVSAEVWQRLGSPDLRTHPTLDVLTSEGTVVVVIVGVTPAQSPDGSYLASWLLYDDFTRLVTADPQFVPSTEYKLWVPPELSDELATRIQRDVAGALGEGWQVDVQRQDYLAWNDSDPLLPIKLAVTGVAVLVLLLGALGLVNIALVTVRQRIREIGIRRSFGATGARVFFAVMLESVVATVVAGAAGVVLSVLLIKNPITQSLIAPALQDIPPFPFEAALIGLGAATLVGALAGLLPALVAVRVKVIDAIRY